LQEYKSRTLFEIFKLIPASNTGNDGNANEVRFVVPPQVVTIFVREL
jgi:hypothetical protein